MPFLNDRYFAPLDPGFAENLRQRADVRSKLPLRGYARTVTGSIPSRAELRVLVQEIEDALARGADDARAWLASEQGRRYRAIAARALVLAAPAILRHPFFRTPVGRLVEVAGGVALLAKVAT
jgi:hypothetical protein